MSKDSTSSDSPDERPRGREIRPLRGILPYLAPYRRQLLLAFVVHR